MDEQQLKNLASDWIRLVTENTAMKSETASLRARLAKLLDDGRCSVCWELRERVEALTQERDELRAKLLDAMCRHGIVVAEHCQSCEIELMGEFNRARQERDTLRARLATAREHHEQLYAGCVNCGAQCGKCRACFGIALATARRDALEEAARVAEDWDYSESALCRGIADAISALAAKESDGG